MKLILRTFIYAVFIAASVVALSAIILMIPVTDEIAKFIASNAAQAIALIAFPAAALMLAKWGNFVRKDYAAAFFLALYAMIILQVPVYVGGMTGWDAHLVLLSGVSRWMLYASAVMFARAMLKVECHPVGWIVVVVFTMTVAVLV